MCVAAVETTRGMEEETDGSEWKRNLASDGSNF